MAFDRKTQIRYVVKRHNGERFTKLPVLLHFESEKVSNIICIPQNDDQNFHLGFLLSA